jgi:anti-sigma B factor antagonist
MEPQPADLQLTTRCLHGHQVVVVAGEIDISTTPVLNAYLLNAAYTTSGKGGIDLVVDLSAVTFMDASGLTVLLRADHRARRAGGRLRLAAPTARIARLLAITHLDLYFDLYPTSEAATHRLRLGGQPVAGDAEPVVDAAASPPIVPGGQAVGDRRGSS